MKKLFYFFIIFISFICFDNVKALSNHYLNFNYDSPHIDNVITPDKVSFTNALKSYIDSSFNRSSFEYVIMYGTDTSNSTNANTIVVYFIKPLPSDRRLIISDYARSGYTSSIGFTRASVPDSDGLVEWYYRTDGYSITFYPSNYDNFTDIDFTDTTIGSNNNLNNFLSDPDNSMSALSGLNFKFDLYNLVGRNFDSDISLYSSSYSGIFRLPYYSSVDIYFSVGDSGLSYVMPLSITYDSITTLYTLGDKFPTYTDLVNGNYQVPINKVADFGNNTYGFYNNFLSVHDIGVGSDVYNVAVICEQDKPFENGYCNLNASDLLNYNSNINFFNKSSLAFTQVFSTTESAGYLYNNKYYMYSFRVLKPFVPSVAGVRLDTSDGVYEVPDSNILSVKKYDGGSYTDYVVSFKIDNTIFSSSTNLNNILVLFGGTLESYYQPIPSTFNLGIYRSFKLQILDNSPTDTEIENFMFTNDLSSIDSAGSQTGFFTDTTFNTFGFSAIITSPFRFLYALENYDSCTDIDLPFPYSNTNLKLKCVRNSIPSSVSPLISILQVILSGFIGYRICVGTFKIIKDLLDPNNYDIEVVDL